MRLVEEFARFLSKILFKKQTGNYLEALEELRNGQVKYSGLDIQLINTIPCDLFPNLLIKLEKHQIFLLVKFLVEESDLIMLTNENEKIDIVIPKIKKAILAYEYLSDSKYYDELKKYITKINNILSALSNSKDLTDSNYTEIINIMKLLKNISIKNVCKD
jgi:hypothetical protein